MTRKEQLLNTAKWNKFFGWANIVMSFINVSIGSLFFIVTIGLAALNFWIAEKCEEEAEREDI